MAAVPDLIKALRDRQADGLPETMFDDLESAYGADIQNITSGATASANEAVAALAAAQAEVSALAAQNQALRAKNYEYMVGGPAAGSQTTDEGANDNAPDVSVDDDPDGVNLRLSDVLSKKNK